MKKIKSLLSLALVMCLAFVTAGFGMPTGLLQANAASTDLLDGTFVDYGPINTTFTPTLTLADLVLPGDYAWDDDTTSLSAGDGQLFGATYTDPSGDYLPASGQITVNVAKADGTFVEISPISVTFTPTLTLADVTLPNNYEWADDTISLDAGDGQVFDAIYTDPSGNFLPATGEVTVNVAKANGTFVNITPINATFTATLTLADLVLPNNYEWVDDTISLDAGDGQVFDAIYTDPSGNFLPANGTITVNVAEADGAFVSIAPINTTFTTTLTLADLTLPSGYAWADGTTSLSAGDGQIFAATYTDPSGNFSPADGTITVNVAKANGTFINITAISTTFTSALTLADLTLPSGYAWVDDTISLDAGNGQTFAATYTDPSGNFNPASGTVTVNVARANGTFINITPISTTFTANLTLADLTLPNGYVWADDTITLFAGDAQVFIAIYTDPSGNFTQAGGEITVNVAKAEIDMSGVVFNGITVTYDGNEHSVFVSNLPNGVTVASYVGNARTEVGTHTVTVNFALENTTNFSVPAPMTATITIVAIQGPSINSQTQGSTITQSLFSYTLSVSATSPDGGTLSFQWFSNTTASNTGGLEIVGATGSTFSASRNVVGTFYYYVVVTNTNSANGASESITSDVITLTISSLNINRDDGNDSSPNYWLTPVIIIFGVVLFAVIFLLCYWVFIVRKENK
jgi:hypothetical protein